MVSALDEILGRHRHVVTQVVEAELVVRAVRDVARVRRLVLATELVRQDHADGQSEETVDLAHPLGVALGEIVVDGDDVHALAGQRVEVGRQGPGERLALTGLHLRDVAEVHRRAAHDLHVERPLVEHALCRLADRGERLRHQVVERLAVGVTLLVILSALAQLVIAQVGVVLLERVDRVGDRLEAAKQAPLTRAEKLLKHGHGNALPQFICRPIVGGAGRYLSAVATTAQAIVMKRTSGVGRV